MLPAPHYVRDCLRRKLLVPSPMAEVYWTPSIAAKLQRAKGRAEPRMDLVDFFVGPCERLAHVRRFANRESSGGWSGTTEIHHIVEHHHLRFLGVVTPVTSQTYRHHEPCVVLATADHNLGMEGVIGDAIRMVLGGQRGVDFLQQFAADNPGASTASDNEQGQRVRDWVKVQETRPGAVITRTRIRDLLLEAYTFAYQGPEFAALRSIATSVIAGVPLQA